MQAAPVDPQDENDAEVRREDQNNINKFARLNARLYELRQEQAELKKQMEGLDDASTELMMGSGSKVLLLQGEAFFETTEEDATAYCEAAVDALQTKMNDLEEEEGIVVAEQNKLKVILYGRFGKSINLEDK